MIAQKANQITNTRIRLCGFIHLDQTVKITITQGCKLPCDSMPFHLMFQSFRMYFQDFCQLGNWYCTMWRHCLLQIHQVDNLTRTTWKPGVDYGHWSWYINFHVITGAFSVRVILSTPMITHFPLAASAALIVSTSSSPKATAH